MRATGGAFGFAALLGTLGCGGQYADVGTVDISASRAIAERKGGGREEAPPPVPRKGKGRPARPAAVPPAVERLRAGTR